MVGARGFEPPTPASRTLCATRLRYAPTEGLPRRKKKGAGRLRSIPSRPAPNFGGEWPVLEAADEVGRIPRRGAQLGALAQEAFDDQHVAILGTCAAMGGRASAHARSTSLTVRCFLG